jgi:hypothetical protein
LADRKACLARARIYLGGSFVVAPKPELPTEEIPDAPIAAEPAKPWWQSTENIGAVVGWLTSVGAAIHSPYGLAAIGIVAVATVVAIYLVVRRINRERIAAPVGEVV